MTLPGLLIEYLVNGAVALTWLYPLLATHFARFTAPLIPVLAAALYVVGMAVDLAAWAITRPMKSRLRRHVHRKYRGDADTESVSGTMRHVKIALHAPDLGRELAMRSSRDRIARGTIVNALLAAAFVLPVFHGAVVILGSVVMWMSFERLSYMYELCAESMVDQRLAREAAATSATTPAG